LTPDTPKKMSLMSRMTPMVSGIRHLSLTPAMMKTAESGAMPKKPATPWSNFYAAQLPHYKKQFPNLRISDLMKKISQGWKEVSDEEKKKLQFIYEKEKEVYSQKMAKVPDAVLSSAKAVKATKKVDKEKRSVKEELKMILEETKKPKRNLSAYLMYCNDVRSGLPASMSPTEKIKKMATDWNNASDALKEKYASKQQKDSDRYAKELAAWNKRIEKDGLKDEIALLEEKISMLNRKSKEL